MIGRASIGYPWIFNEIKSFVNSGLILEPPSMTDRVLAVEDHLSMSIQWKGNKVGIAEMKRHYGNYFRGIPHFKDFKTRLVTSSEHDEVLAILEEIKKTYLNIDLSLEDIPY
jgi:tRNA-dihydrouridine synthase